MKWQTVYLGRLLGIFTTITVLWLITDKQRTETILPALLGDRPALMILAILALLAGLGIVLAHNIWSGGLLPVLVTLVGWLMVVRGILLLFLSERDLTRILTTMKFGQFFYLYLLAPLAFGLLLTLLGFTAQLRLTD